MADDPWAAFRTSPQAPAAPAADDPWAQFRASPAQPTGALGAAMAARTPAPAPPTGPRPQAAVQAEYDAKPWYAQAGQAADDIIRSLANGMSFGYADKLAGAMNGTGVEAERAKSSEAQMRAGSAGTVAEIGGAVATPVTAGRYGLMATKLAKDVPGVTGALARTGLAAAEGAGYGMTDAAGHDRSVADGALLGAIFGGGGNALGEAAIGSANKVAGWFNKKPVIPTQDEVLSSARAAYDAADNAGVAYAPQSIDRIKNNVITQLTDMGYDPALQPGAKAVLDRLEQMTGQNVTFKGLDTLRKVAGNGYSKDNPSNNKAIGHIVSAIDDLVSNPAAGDVLTGNAQAAGDAIKTAREMWSRLAKSEAVGEAVKRGELNAAASGTGWNTENALRQSFKGMANDKAAVRGFTPDESAALRTVIEGTPDQNLLRYLGRLAPTGIMSSGISSGGGAAIGNAIGGPTGAIAGAMALPAAGFGARTMATNMELNGVNRLADIILGGGSAAAVTPKTNAVQNALTTNRDDLLNAIFGVSQNQAGKANERLHPKGPVR